MILMFTPSRAGSKGCHHCVNNSCLPLIGLCTPPGAIGALKTTSSLYGIVAKDFVLNDSK